MVDPGIRPHRNADLAKHGMKEYSRINHDGPISASFIIPGGTPWHQTQDFIQKVSSSRSFARLNVLNSPRNPINLTLGIQTPYYKTNPYISSGKTGYDFTPRVTRDFPVCISSIGWTNIQIQKILKEPHLSTFHIQAGSIPYETTLKPAFYKNLWAGNIELIDVAKLQFHTDRNIHNELKRDYIDKLSKWNDLTKTSINHLRSSIGFGYGKYSYPIWDVVDALQVFIPVPGVRNTYLTQARKCAPHSYYSSVYNLAHQLDTYWHPNVADQFIRAYLSPIYLVNDPVVRSRAILLYNNWRSIKGKTGFIAHFGKSQDNWEIFLYPSDMRFINSFANSLELIAYLNNENMGELQYGRSNRVQWRNFYGRGLENAIENLAWIYLGNATKPNSFQDCTLSDLSREISLLPYDKALLLNSIAHVLSAPWKITHNPTHFNLKYRIASFIHYTAPKHYYDFSMTTTSWSFNQPLFLSDFGNSLKPFYGLFGESNTMRIKMNFFNGIEVTRDVAWNIFSQAEYDFLNSMQLLLKSITRTTGILRPGIERVWGSESIGEGRLSWKLSVQHRDIFGNLHNQFGDFAQKLKGGEALFYEIYGDMSLGYFNTNELKCPAWVTKGYPVIFSPTTSVITSTLFNRFRPQYLFRAAPFHDNKEQGELFQKIMGNIVSESILANPTNPHNWLHFHDVLFGMRIPANMQNWHIYNYFSTQQVAIDWVARIQFIFGIHINPSTFEFDYIINNHGLNIPSTVPNFNPAINLPDPKYDAQMDPFSPKFLKIMVSGNILDVQNNYKYIWWKNYFDFLSGYNNRFWILMDYLSRI